MRLQQLVEMYVNELPLFSVKEKTPEEIAAGGRMVAKFILEHCAPYLKEKPKYNELYRGIRNAGVYNMAFIKNVAKDRAPRDSTSRQNTFFIDLIAHKGYTANRNNSIFTSPSMTKAQYFGIPYVVFPIDEFAFTWGFDDMTEQVSHDDVALYNKHAKAVYDAAYAKMKAAEELFDKLHNPKKEAAWIEKTPEQKELLNQAVRDMNINPYLEATNYLRTAPEDKLRDWDWNASQGLLNKLKSESDSTLEHAFEGTGEIMISCKNYLCLEPKFHEEHVRRYIIDRT